MVLFAICRLWEVWWCSVIDKKVLLNTFHMV